MYSALTARVQREAEMAWEGRDKSIYANSFTYRRRCGRDCRSSWGSEEDGAHLALFDHCTGPRAFPEDSPQQMQPSVRDESVRFVQKLRPFDGFNYSINWSDWLGKVHHNNQLSIISMQRLTDLVSSRQESIHKIGISGQIDWPFIHLNQTR